MGLFGLFRRKKKDDEVTRRARLLLSGRIVEGRVHDIGTDEAGEITHIFYTYLISGVNYESSQVLDPDQRNNIEDYMPGSIVVVRYDPRRPSNSVVV
jgi:hypothetical protein